MKLLRSAFVFGKYYPFHVGHAALINFALQKSERVYVIVCASNKERQYSLSQRVKWIAEHYQTNPHLEIIPFYYQEEELANSSIPDKEISKAWSDKFAGLLPNEVEAVVTSELYGEYVAAFIGIKHLMFDNSRLHNPISATDIRQKPLTHWHFLPESVKPALVKKIVVNGTESTGKTTLCQKLAAQYSTVWVPEAGREVVAHTENCTPAHLPLILKKHARNIEQQSKRANKLLIIDTDCYITASYSQFLFGEELLIPEEIRKSNSADVMLYCNTEASYIQDGTRLSLNDRNKLDSHHQLMLAEEKANYHQLTGQNWEDRFHQACKVIDSYLAEW